MLSYPYFEYSNDPTKQNIATASINGDAANTETCHYDLVNLTRRTRSDGANGLHADHSSDSHLLQCSYFPTENTILVVSRTSRGVSSVLYHRPPHTVFHSTLILHLSARYIARGRRAQTGQPADTLRRGSGGSPCSSTFPSDTLAPR